MQDWWHSRDVREEPSFREAARAIEPDAKRFDDLYAAICYLISRAAESCPEVAGTPFRVARAQETAGTPILRVLFTINSDDLCSCWWVDLADEGFDDEEDAS